MLPPSKFCWGPSISDALTYHCSPHINGNTRQSTPFAVISHRPQALCSVRILLYFMTPALHVPKAIAQEAFYELILGVLYSFMMTLVLSVLSEMVAVGVGHMPYRLSALVLCSDSQLSATAHPFLHAWLLGDISCSVCVQQGYQDKAEWESGTFTGLWAPENSQRAVANWKLLSADLVCLCLVYDQGDRLTENSAWR